MDFASPDPLRILTLRFDRHCYGSNLSTALLSVQQDHEINRLNEDRFQVSGFESVGRPVLGVSAQKTAGRAILEHMLTLLYDPAFLPVILSVSIPRRHAPVGSLGLPPFVFKFADSTIASQVRRKLLAHARSSTLPALKRVWVEPILTKASLVRIEIMLAMRRVLTDRGIRCTVQRFGRSPLLHTVSGGRERVYGFVPSCEAFGHLLNAERLSLAYRVAGRLFCNRLTAAFLVLFDGAQPTVSFTIPTPRPSLPVPSTSNPERTLSLQTPRIPPLLKPSYLEQVLSAPVASGSGSGSGSGFASGRKRPAETSSSDNLSGKRTAP